MPEMPGAILVMDFDIGLADEESSWWTEYEYDCVDENGQVEETENEHDLAEGEDCMHEDEEIDDDYDGYDCCEDDEMAEYEELNLITAEFFGDADSWERSNDDGWYYDD